MADHTIHRGFVNTPNGQIHYAEAGQGEPVLLLHQTPRSWTEYEQVLPILGKRFRAIAMDTIGFGDSYRPRVKASIEHYASGVVDFLDAMEIDRTSLVGHHTGGLIAFEFAASWPQRVYKLILSSCPFTDEADRERRKTRPPIDKVTFSADGSHLTELWNKRQPFYPKGRPDLIARFMLDALKVLDQVEEGHHAVNAYKMEEKTRSITSPTLIMAGTEDPFAYPRMDPLSKAIKGSLTAEIEGGMVPMPEQMPDVFSQCILDFI
ncbi:alpha/beta hydrolase [Desulfobacula sp.]|uniref:alpha/beta fold hydrolase n=1 Tax=Desulfobacula sp. TaxID=2593537 RepID=UPI0026189998|nr:alpha/beta hydrolase [Desulfobacula sp.]